MVDDEIVCDLNPNGAIDTYGAPSEFSFNVVVQHDHGHPLSVDVDRVTT